MTDNLHIADADLTLYAMGGLAPAETEQARAHLLGCQLCCEELRQYTLALAAYAQATPDAGLPQGAKDRFMARVAQTTKSQATTAVAAETAAAPGQAPFQASTQPSTPASQAAPAKSSFWGSLFGSGDPMGQ